MRRSALARVKVLLSPRGRGQDEGGELCCVVRVDLLVDDDHAAAIDAFLELSDRGRPIGAGDLGLRFDNQAPQGVRELLGTRHRVHPVRPDDPHEARVALHRPAVGVHLDGMALEVVLRLLERIGGRLEIASLMAAEARDRPSRPADRSRQ